MFVITFKCIVCILACGFVAALLKRAVHNRRDNLKTQAAGRLPDEILQANQICYFCGKASNEKTVWEQPMYGEHKVFHDINATRHIWTNVSVKIPCCLTCHDELDSQGRKWIMMRASLALVIPFIAFLCLAMTIRAENVFLQIMTAAFISTPLALIMWKLTKAISRPEVGIFGKACSHPDVEMLKDRGFRCGRSPGRAIKK